MSEFNTKCPCCGAILVANDEWCGKVVQCFTCNNKFRLEKLSPEEISCSVQRACSNCGANIDQEMRFCSQCGTMSAAPQRICPNCKSPIVAGMHFCHQCGLLIEEKYEKTLMDSVGTTVKVATDKLGNWLDKLKSNFS